MSAVFSLLARVRAQGPAAPLVGDAFALPVYTYEAMAEAGTIGRGDLLYVAHREADPDDPGFAVGAVRQLQLTESLPSHASLLFAGERPAGVRCWFCPASQPSNAEAAR